MKKHLLLVLLLGCEHTSHAVADAELPIDSAIASDSAITSDVVVLPSGTATSMPATCPAGVFPGSTCMQVDVTCPGIGPDSATLAITQPSGTAKGTLLMMAGGGGTKFFDVSDYSTYLNAGLRLVEIAWATDWPSSGSMSPLTGACRAATLSRWIFDNVHGGDAVAHTAGFCGLGISGGGAFFAYSVAHYGEKNIYDYLSILSGPSVSRLDYGCDPSLYTGAPRYLCPLLPDPPFAFDSEFIPGINGMNQTTTCGAASPAPADIAKWTANSIVSPGADYQYPQTAMSFWFCAGTMLNESSGLGSFLVEQVRPLGQPAPVGCYTQCTGENVLADPAGKQAQEDAMIAGCVPRH
jgi:hypothetical protein